MGGGIPDTGVWYPGGNQPPGSVIPIPLFGVGYTIVKANACTMVHLL